MLPLLLAGQLLSANIHWTGPKLSAVEAAAILAKSPGGANLTGKTLTTGDGPTAIILDGGSPLGDPRELTWDWRPLNCCPSYFDGFPWYSPGYGPGALAPSGYLNPALFFAPGGVPPSRGPMFPSLGRQGRPERRSASTAAVTSASPGRTAPPTTSVHRSSAMPESMTTGSKRP